MSIVFSQCGEALPFLDGRALPFLGCGSLQFSGGGALLLLGGGAVPFPEDILCWFFTIAPLFIRTLIQLQVRTFLKDSIKL